MCGCSGCFKFTANYSSVGPKQSAAERAATDSVIDKDDDTSGGAGVQTLTVDGQELYDTINAPNDVDFFKVELVAGRTYDIGQFLVTDGASKGGSGVALADAFFEVFDSTGKLVASADGGGPDTPSGLDALLTLTAEMTGTYFIRARSYDNDGANGPDGDFVGDYKVFVKSSTAEPYVPYYNTDSPLHSLDWGSQLVRSSRNPDGAEGPRPTGNPAGTGTVIGGGADGSAHDNVGNVQPVAGKTVITYYFAKVGDASLLDDPTTPGLDSIPQGRVIEQYEKDAYRAAFAEYEKIADVLYVEVNDISQAYFKIFTYTGTPGTASPSLLGRASPPGEENEGQMEFNANDYRYNESGLTKGGFFFPTLLHEMGHAHGLAHPHDNGGRSSVMRGGGGGTGGIGGAYGDFGLSQGIFTMMSYNDGWDMRPDGTRASPPIPATAQTAAQQPNYGFVGSFGALDIALIQDKYGVNEEYATGNDVYVLKDVNAKGTFYETIWDAGGIDEIRYEGSRNTVIDLRAATLKYEIGGGGWVSYTKDIFGGFTIANGVVIENARGGAGSDRLTGNAGGNVLEGGAGNDILFGLGGDDLMFGGLGDDSFEVTEAGDRVVELGGQGVDVVFSYLGGYTLPENIEVLSLQGSAAVVGVGNELNNVLYGTAGDNVLIGMGGDDTMFGGLGNDAYEVTEAGDSVVEFAGEGTDTVYSYIGGYTLADNAEILSLQGSAVVGIGNAGNNVLFGNAGNNVLNGGAGDDRLIGGAGADTFWFLGRDAGRDRIADFNVADDTVVLDRSMFADYAAVQARISQVGADVVLTHESGAVLTLENILLSQLTADDFSFYS
jgi:Ca2+-binding RTX toxin-like protein